MKKALTSKVVRSILAFIFIFFTGWSSAMLLVQIERSEPIYNHLILGGFSLIFGILQLYKLINSK